MSSRSTGSKSARRGRRRCGRDGADRRPDAAVRWFRRGRCWSLTGSAFAGRASTSISLRIRVSGLRSSCDASATNCFCRRIASSSRSSVRSSCGRGGRSRRRFPARPRAVRGCCRDLGHLDSHLLHRPQRSAGEPPRQRAEHHDDDGHHDRQQPRQDADRSVTSSLLTPTISTLTRPRTRSGGPAHGRSRFVLGPLRDGLHPARNGRDRRRTREVVDERHNCRPPTTWTSRSSSPGARSARSSATTAAIVSERCSSPSSRLSVSCPRSTRSSTPTTPTAARREITCECGDAKADRATHRRSTAVGAAGSRRRGQFRSPADRTARRSPRGVGGCRPRRC